MGAGILSFEQALETADMGMAGLLALIDAALVWSLLGWTRREVAKAFQGVRESVSAHVAEAERGARVWWEAVLGRFGHGHAAKDQVTLGEVSEMIDIIRLGLMAGLSFDAALGLYCEGRPGALGSCMAKARLSWQTSLMTREEALLQAARELDIRALETFAVAVGQALELGAPLADTLAGQSREIRAAHRAEVEREIERAPVKLLIPTGTLILPALLLSILGPLLAAGGML